MKQTNLPKQWILWIALMLVLFALPSFVARLLMLSGDPVRDYLLANKKVEAEELNRFEESRLRVVDWFSHSTITGDLAVLSLQRTQHQTAQQDQDYFAQAARWQRRGLADTPADPYGWFRMAFLFFREDGASMRVAQAWVQSLSVAPYEPRLTLARLQMGMKLEGFLNEEEQRFIPILIRAQADASLEALAITALRGRFVSIVEDALENEEEKLLAFRLKVSQLLAATKKNK